MNHRPGPNDTNFRIARRKGVHINLANDCKSEESNDDHVHVDLHVDPNGDLHVNFINPVLSYYYIVLPCYVTLLLLLLLKPR
jgi:hypothetical protein